MKNLSKLGETFLYLLILVILVMGIKGAFGNGVSQAQSLTSAGEAFESSIARGRYALVLALADSGRWDLSEELAKFGAPYVSKTKNSYVSIFPPGIALIIAPFYMLGKYVNMGQLFTSLGIVLITFINFLLIFKLGARLGMPRKISLLSGLLYTFASNSFAYSVIISQHQVTTLLVLLCIHIALLKKTIWKHMIFWFLYGASVLVDWPNLVLIFPVAAYLVFTEILTIEVNTQKIKISLMNWALPFVILTTIPLLFYANYNIKTTGNPFLFGQILPRFTVTNTPKIEKKEPKKTSLAPFNSEKMPHGLFVLLFGTERGILFYFPIYLVSIFGIYEMYKRVGSKTYMLLGIPIVNLLLYSMFGDVWGGWAFGPRYVIPSFAILSLFVGQSVVRYHKKIFFMMIFSILLAISIVISTLGALTTTLIPPQREAVGLGLDHTIQATIKHLTQLPLGSFIYNQFLHPYLDNVQFYIITVSVIAVCILIVLISAIRKLSTYEIIEKS